MALFGLVWFWTAGWFRTLRALGSPAEALMSGGNKIEDTKINKKYFAVSKLIKVFVFCHKALDVARE
jgi:hypothetical protein